MPKKLTDNRAVYVIGVGWHRYQPLSDTTFVGLGLTAARMALDDAGLPWPEVETAYIGHGLLGMAAGRQILRHLGATGIPLVHIENASASGSAAFRHACIEVAGGMADVALVLGVDKPAPVRRAAEEVGIDNLAEDAIVPFTHFALLTNEYAHRHGVTEEDVALVAVKNHRNGSLNPHAHRQQERTLDEILGGRRISGTLTTLQCCPVGEGAAAAIVASEDAIKRLGLDMSRAVRVTASAAVSGKAAQSGGADVEITAETMAAALAQAGVAPRDVDIVEMHDAFTIEELHYIEAMGVCKPGEAIHLLKEGAFDIGGSVAVSPSGGLIAMGHPIGPTGVGQVGEITQQLRGEAGPRQHKGAKIGLAHMVGLGPVAYVHMFERA